MTRSARFPLLSFLVLAAVLAPMALPPALAQDGPVIVSTVPANLATGVSPTAPVVITFGTPLLYTQSGLIGPTLILTHT